MNSNLRRQSNPGQFAAVLRGVIIVAFCSIAGLSYEYLKIQMDAGGRQKHALERELADLLSQNNVMEKQIVELTSPTALRHRLDEGFIKLVPITSQAVVRVRAFDSSHWSSEERPVSDFHPVSHEIRLRH